MKRPSIAIVGAGVAGLACARRLVNARFNIRLFDKGRSPRGRLATRRIETTSGEARFDHGVQYISVREPALARLMEDFALAGAAALWDFDDGAAPQKVPSRSPARRWVGTPGMSAIARHMTEGLVIQTSARVTGVRTDGAGWRLHVDRAGQPHSESEGPFDAVVVALPAEQAAPLLAPIAPDLAAEASTAQTGPCWAGLFAFDRRFVAPFEVRRFSAGEAVTWVARQTSKPGRTGPEAWVVHASPAWSRAHVDLKPEEAAEALWLMFRDLASEAPKPIWRQAHLWRYAFVETTASSRFSWDSVLRLGVCGDWRVGHRGEAAWLSGDSLGAAMRTTFDQDESGLIGASSEKAYDNES